MIYFLRIPGFFLALFLAVSSHSQNLKLDSLLRTFGTEASDTLKIKTALRISYTYVNKGIADSACLYARLSFSLSKKANFLRGLGSASNYLGQACNYTGKSDSAAYFFREAMAYYKRAGDLKREVGMLNNLGIVYKDQGNIPKALEYYFLALKAKEQQHDSEGIANAYHNIGQLYADADDTSNTIKYYLQALKIRRASGDLSGVGASLIAMGTFYEKRKNQELARKQFREALDIAEKLGEEESIAIACYNLGNIHNKNGKFAEARRLYRRSLEISRKNENLKGIAVCLEVLGELDLSEGHYPAAIKQLEESYTLTKEMESMELLGGICAKLSKAYEKTGNYKRAIELLKESDAAEDSLFSKENIRRITSEGLRYEHEKEKLVLRIEQEKKEALAKSEAQRKNFFLILILIFLIVVCGFSYSLFQKLRENRRQKRIIEEQKNEMVASINYARRIQYALLAQSQFLSEHLPEHFVLFKPKDIVSGDFYWATLKNGFFYLAVCDSTGHGVPGAFMSLLNINYLNEAINGKGIVSPGEILNHVRKRLIQNMGGGKDGMDSILLKIPVKKEKAFVIEYAAANNAPVLVRKGQVSELAKDKMPVGQGESLNSFITHSFETENGDTIYLYTDGYADQFGGAKGKKFKRKQLDEQLMAHSDKTMSQQQEALLTAFENWRGAQEQVDDVCIVGLRV